MMTQAMAHQQTKQTAPSPGEDCEDYAMTGKKENGLPPD